MASTPVVSHDGRPMPSSYDAFISYSHRRDRELAKAVQDSLEQFARPLLKSRSMRVFRDETNLDASPDLWGTIAHALDESRFLILIASPASAKSRWIPLEVEHFLKSHPKSSVCFVVSGGILPWMEARPIEETLGLAESAIAPDVYAMVQASDVEPLVIDLSPFVGSSPEERMASPEYHSKVASIAARILGRDKDKLFGEHLSRQRRILFAVSAVAIVTIVLAITAGAFGFKERVARHDAQNQESIAKKQTNLAEQQTTIANQQREQAKRQEALANQNAALAKQQSQLATEAASKEREQRLRAEEGERAARSRQMLVESDLLRKNGRLAESLTLAIQSQKLLTGPEVVGAIFQDTQPFVTPTLRLGGTIDFSPNPPYLVCSSGSYLPFFVAATESGKLGMWHLPTSSAGEALFDLPSHVRSLAVSTTSPHLAVGYTSNQVLVANLSDNHQSILRTTKEPVALAFSPAEPLLAIAEAGGQVSVARVDRDEQPHPLQKLESEVSKIGFTSDGKVLIALATPAAPVDGRTPIPCTAPKQSGFDIQSIAASGKEAHAAGDVLRVDVASGAIASSRSIDGKVTASAFGAKGSMIYAVAREHGRSRLVVENLGNGDADSSPSVEMGYQGSISLVAVSGGRRYAVVASQSSAGLWDVQAKRSVTALPTSSPIVAAAFGKDDRYLVLATQTGRIEAWETGIGSGEVAIPLHRKLNVFAFSADGRSLLGGADADSSGNGALYVWSALDGRELLEREDGPGGVSSIKVWRDFIVTAHGRDSIRVTELKGTSATTVTEFRSGLVRDIAVSQDGQYLAAGDGDSASVSMWSGWRDKSPTLVRTLHLPKGDDISALAFDPQSTTLFASMPNGLFVQKPGGVSVWRRWKSGRLQPTLVKRGDVAELGLSFDHQLVEACASKTRIRFSDPATLQTETDLFVSKKGISAMAVSHDGTRIAAAVDGDVRVWDLRTRQELGRFPIKDVRAIAFDPKTPRIATATEESIQIWRFQPSDVVAEAFRRLQIAGEPPPDASQGKRDRAPVCPAEP